MFFHERSLHDVVVGVSHSGAVRFDDEHCADVRDNAEATTIVWVAASVSVGNAAAESLDWSHWSSFDNCCQIFGSFSRLLKDKRCHLARSLQLRSFSWQSCGGSRQALGLPDVDILLASLAVPQQLVLSEADPQVGDSPKKKVNISTVINQQDETELPTLQQVPGRHLLSKPHGHSRSGGDKGSSAIARAHCCFGKACNGLMKLRSWIRQPDGALNNHRCSGTTRFRQPSRSWISVQGALQQLTCELPSPSTRWSFVSKQFVARLVLCVFLGKSRRRTIAFLFS